jgi:predicted GH43/DUF377 family glycosyl hydrolase
MFTKRCLFVFVVVAALTVAALWFARVPLASGQDAQPVKVEFAAYEGNPILAVGEAGAWDAGRIVEPSVVFYDGLYYMFYTGFSSNWSIVAIGYATSSDGLAWEKYAENPVFQGDGTGFDSTSIIGCVVLVEDDTWTLYYQGSTGRQDAVGRATAPSPSGPWTRQEEHVLTVGSPGEWDEPSIGVHSVIATDEGYVMYYPGGDLVNMRGGGIGRATSPDGITWTKYDDPATTESPYAESDPVLQPGPEAWDKDFLAGGGARRTADGWEIFYFGKGQLEGQAESLTSIGYATSDDGIHWTKYDGNPILTAEDDPAEPAANYANLGMSRVFVRDSAYFLYYDYLWLQPAGIGVATGTVTWE